MAAKTEAPSRRWLPSDKLPIWQRVVEPSPLITSLSERRQARITASLMFYMGLLGTVYTLFFTVPFTISFYVPIAFILSMAASYVLARTRYHIWGGLLAVIALIAGMAVNTLLPDFQQDRSINLMFTLAAVIVATIITSFWGTIFVAIVGVGVVGSLLFIAPGMETLPAKDIVFCIVFLSTTVVLAHRHQHLMEKDRRTELHDVNQELSKALEETQKRAAEAQLASLQAQEANRLKSEFLATMSHELRTPLNAMIGFSEIMLGGMGGTLDSDANNMVTRIHANSLSLLALINDVLDISRIEAKRIEIASSQISIRSLSEKVCKQMESLAEKKNLKFEHKVDEAVPDLLVGDSEFLERIMLNLLSNAFKFTQQGSVALRIACSTARNEWTITVSDSGIGIPIHAREYIFDPFRQVDGSSSRAYGGTGLGLAIVKELVHLMGGTIQLESVVDRGSTFVVGLPLVIAAPEVEKQAVL